MEKFFTPENKIDNKTEVILSPSARFQLTINVYRTGTNTWNYSECIITRINDQKIVAEIKRNYPVFHHTFFVKDNEEWLQTGKTYQSQIFVNLDTEQIYDNSDKADYHDFCWAQSLISPDGNTLAVNGCYWGAMYEYRFFDFTDPLKGWPELPTEKCLDTGDYDGHWNDDDTFTVYFTRWIDDEDKEDLVGVKPEQIIKINGENSFILEEKTTVKRENNKMIIVDFWKSEN